MILCDVNVLMYAFRVDAQRHEEYRAWLQERLTGPFTQAIRSRPNSVTVTPGPRHRHIFHDLRVRAKAKGNLVTDAYFAALAIEWGCEWISTDGEYARFPGLTWRRPLD